MMMTRGAGEEEQEGGFIAVVSACQRLVSWLNASVPTVHIAPTVAERLSNAFALVPPLGCGWIALGGLGIALSLGKARIGPAPWPAEARCSLCMEAGRPPAVAHAFPSPGGSLPSSLQCQRCTGRRQS